MQHYPVMVAECLDYLNVQPDGLYCDATAGLGGHSGAIARKLTTGLLLACDRDAESLEIARANTADCGSRIHFHQALFSQLEETLRSAQAVSRGVKQETNSDLAAAGESVVRETLRSAPGEAASSPGMEHAADAFRHARKRTTEGIALLDGLVADLGVSRHQLTLGERGFSLMADGPLDMRMSRGQGERTAADIVNFESEKELAHLIFTLGEERRSRKIARAIVRGRPVTTTGQLAKLIEGVVPRTSKLHPATQTFMALRIAVNNELEELGALLDSIPRLIGSGGRAVIITFMSLEDRRVKQSFQAMAKGGRAKLLTRHVVRPAPGEIRDNPPSRSAKLRAIELL